MKGEIIPESAVRFIRTLPAPHRRADIFPKNAALYGVDLNKLKG
jgi:hypothetical protein